MPTQNEAKKGRNFRSLTVTLALAFLALSTVVLLIASGLELYFNFQTQQQVIVSQQQLIAQDAANTVKSFVQDKFSMMESTASISSMAIENQEQQKNVLDKLLGREPSFRQLVLLDAQNRKLAEVSRLSQSASRIDSRLDSNLFAQIQDGEKYVSSVYIDNITSEPMMIMTVPVKDIFGDLKGTLVAEVNLKFMWDLVGRIKIGDKGVAYVVDRQGDLIAFGDISRVLRGENLIHLEKVNDFVSSKGLIITGESGTSKGIQGNSVIANYAPLGMPDWAVVVELPVEEAYQAVAQGVVMSALIMLLGIFLAVVAGIYLSRRITRPIIGLRDAAIKIGQGALDTQIEVKSRNEIGDLASAFRQMMDDLKKSRAKLEHHQQELEKNVDERTKELQAKVEELQKFNRLAVGRELRMIELKKRIRELESKRR
ncbi:MAG: cache domain-containing protein [Candidatus Aenigmarchaeota archaeon]|nr:cache domain-containing protein [Candidatus Aenigmarchaeota archaeon]